MHPLPTHTKIWATFHPTRKPKPKLTRFEQLEEDEYGKQVSDNFDVKHEHNLSRHANTVRFDALLTRHKLEHEILMACEYDD